MTDYKGKKVEPGQLKGGDHILGSGGKPREVVEPRPGVGLLHRVNIMALQKSARLPGFDCSAATSLSLVLVDSSYRKYQAVEYAGGTDDDIKARLNVVLGGGEFPGEPLSQRRHNPAPAAIKVHEGTRSFVDAVKHAVYWGLEVRQNTSGTGYRTFVNKLNGVSNVYMGPKSYSVMLNGRGRGNVHFAFDRMFSGASPLGHATRKYDNKDDAFAAALTFARQEQSGKASLHNLADRWQKELANGKAEHSIVVDASIPTLRLVQYRNGGPMVRITYNPKGQDAMSRSYRFQGPIGLGADAHGEVNEARLPATYALRATVRYQDCLEVHGYQRPTLVQAGHVAP
jgi:hypothetical protein